MKNYLNRIDNLKKELESLSPLKPEDQKRLDKKFRLEFNYNSNHIEGNTLTYGETELLLFFDNTKGDHTLREFEEMKAHDIAYLKISEWAKEERPISETDIKELNRIILVRNFWKEAITLDNQPTRREIKVGNYKELPNSVRLENGEMFDYASPTETPIKMQEMMDWYKTEGKDFHPVDLAAILHYKFVRIHPFDDGNGRVARLLLNYVLLKNNFPPIVIKSTDKKNYLSALNKADVGDLEAFSKYIAEQLIWSLELSIKAGKGENIDEANDWEKQVKLLSKDINNQNKIIRTKNSFEAFYDIYQNTLIPLVEIWNEKISIFDDFFETKEVIIEISTDNGIIKTIGSDLEDFFYKTFSDSLANLGLVYNEINIYVNFIKLKKSNISNVFSGGKFEMQLDNYSYEIDTEESSYSLYYGEYLSETKIEEIINFYGKSLLTKIENEIIR